MVSPTRACVGPSTTSCGSGIGQVSCAQNAAPCFGGAPCGVQGAFVGTVQSGSPVAKQHASLTTGAGHCAHELPAPRKLPPLHCAGMPFSRQPPPSKQHAPVTPRQSESWKVVVGGPL